METICCIIIVCVFVAAVKEWYHKRLDLDKKRTA